MGRLPWNGADGAPFLDERPRGRAARRSGIRRAGVPDAIERALAGGEALAVSHAGLGYGVLVFDAARANSDLVAFVVRHSSGLVQVALQGSVCERLALGLPAGSDHMGHAVTVDAAAGISTGISAHDRAHTIRLLSDPHATVADFNRPGHVIPIAAPNLSPCTAAGAIAPALFRAAPNGWAFAEIVSDTRPTELAGPQEIDAFAASYGLHVLRVNARCRQLEGQGRELLRHLAVSPFRIRREG